MTITISYNGKAIDCETALPLTDLLASHNNNQYAFAVAINGTVVPHNEIDTVLLQQGDLIDVVSPIAGG